MDLYTQWIPTCWLLVTRWQNLFSAAALITRLVHWTVITIQNQATMLQRLSVTPGGNFPAPVIPSVKPRPREIRWVSVAKILLFDWHFSSFFHNLDILTYLYLLVRCQHYPKPAEKYQLIAPPALVAASFSTLLRTLSCCRCTDFLRITFAARRKQATRIRDEWNTETAILTSTLHAIEHLHQCLKHICIHRLDLATKTYKNSTQKV